MNRRKKRYRKAYVSCKGIRKADYIRAINKRYSLIFTEELDKAEFIIVPLEKDGLTQRQKQDLERAKALGIEQNVIKAELILDSEIEDPLDINKELMEEKEQSKDTRYYEYDDELELTL